MSYRVVFSPEAEAQLVALYGYIAAAASPDIAARYTEAIPAKDRHHDAVEFFEPNYGAHQQGAADLASALSLSAKHYNICSV